MTNWNLNGYKDTDKELISNLEEQVKDLLKQVNDEKLKNKELLHELHAANKKLLEQQEQRINETQTMIDWMNRIQEEKEYESV